MAGNTATLEFAGDADKLRKAAAQAQSATKDVADTVASSSDAMKDAAKESQSYSDRLGKLGAAAAGMSSAIDDAGNSLQALVDFQQRGRERAMALARAQADVEQANLDAAQAVQDYRQAQEDANQAAVDGKQGAIDAAQAAIDLKQANLDAEQAQTAYNTAVREHGADSVEAKQASIDLAQAQKDISQANLDAEQAQRDINQAQLDGTQATQDMAQAQRDGKDAALDLAQAQREAHPSSMAGAAAELQAYGAVAAGVAGVVNLLAMAYAAVDLAAIRSTASQVAAKVATMASSVAAGVATAAQWLWNAAMDANPIGIIIVAIGALVAGIVWVATKTTWFQDLWHATWDGMKAAAEWVANAVVSYVHWVGDNYAMVWGWIKDVTSAVADAVVGYVKWIIGNYQWAIGVLRNVFSGVWDIITTPFKAAFNFVADAWNNTIGGLRWTVPSWVPGIGGNTIGAPKLPHFHTGGVVPGAPGQEMLAVLQAGETVTPAGRGGARVLEVRIAPGSDQRLVRELLKMLSFADRTGLAGA